MKNDFNNIIKLIQNDKLANRLLEGKFGVEKENVRVDQDGKLALTPHPEALGDKNSHPYITTDFSESQVEMVTPPLETIAELSDFIATLHDIVTENIGEELLWPQSLPPILPDESKIPIARFGEKGRDKETYRELLSRIYGKERQLISGVHFNFSFSDDLFRLLFNEFDDENDFEAFKEVAYFRMVRNIMRYRWILIWLFGKSPKTEDSFKVKSFSSDAYESVHCPKGISLRNCRTGYRNKEDYYINYSSSNSYHQSIKALVDSGKLSFDKELYHPVRVKYLDQNPQISHIELRLLDLDPLEKTGISDTSLYFFHLFAIYCLFINEESDFNKDEQIIANANHDQAACGGLNKDMEISLFSGKSMKANKWAKNFITDMSDFLNKHSVLENKSYRKAFKKVITFVENPEKRVANYISKEIEQDGFINFHLQKAKTYKEETLKKGFNFYGLDDMELSTQLLLKAAVLRGLDFQILDRKANFIKLEYDGKIHYVKQATQTSLDNYSSVLLMDNKQLTKKILNENGINTANGKQYLDFEIAKNDFNCFKNKAIVIKPNSTNFGIGITIIKNNNDQKIYKRALEIAFENDDTILIEAFFEGDEYRFFVINDKVEGILNRVPANVLGDGKKSIKELVAIKNDNPIRGKSYRSPLEELNMGEAESIFLASQSFDFNTIPPKNEIVYLRENSNISTGGDSIAVTDLVHQSYKDIAVKAANALNVSITGLDMIVKDFTIPATRDNYCIIELNFNPAIHIHCYPHKGVRKKLNDRLLDALGF